MSPKLGSGATKSSTVPVGTLTTKDSIQTESVPSTSEKAKANVTTKEKKPIIATKLDDSESETLSSKDNDESDEEYAGEEESEEEEAIPTKPTSKSTASTKDKGKGI